MTETPPQVLERLYHKVASDPDTPLVTSAAILKRIESIVRCMENRASVRLLMACMTGKIDRPLTTDVTIVGRPAQVYRDTLQVLDDVANGRVTAEYERLGVEVAVLDCISFLRHFLHFFHRVRIEFLDAYQALVLAEPDSAVEPPLKEVFLSLRQAAEYDD